MKNKAMLPSIFRRLGAKQSTVVYESFSSALKDSHTYQDSRVIDIVARKTQTYIKQLLDVGSERKIEDYQIVQNLLVLEHVFKGRSLDVVDFGGACGAAFFSLNDLRPEIINRWNIVETPMMVATAKRVFLDAKLSFYEQLNEAVARLENPDLLIAQGVLQFTEDPLQTLKILLNKNFAYVYVARTIVGENITHPIITNQVIKLSSHGPGAPPSGFVDSETSQPRTIIPYEQYKACITPEYHTVFAFSDNQSNTFVAGGRKIVTRTIGLLLKRK